MSRNIQQVYTDNPTTTFQATDLMYLGRSPYNATDDFGFTYASLSAQFAPAAGGVTWIDAGVSQTMAAQTGYKTTGAGLITLTLPTTIADNALIEIGGFGAGGWTIAQNTGQQIIFSSQATTLGAGGSVSSTNRYDCLRLLVAAANTTFLVLSSVGNLTIV